MRPMESHFISSLVLGFVFFMKGCLSPFSTWLWIRILRFHFQLCHYFALRSQTQCSISRLNFPSCFTNNRSSASSQSTTEQEKRAEAGGSGGVGRADPETHRNRVTQLFNQGMHESPLLCDKWRVIKSDRSRISASDNDRLCSQAPASCWWLCTISQFRTVPVGSVITVLADVIHVLL